jgi:hypothetical protein
MPDRLPANVKYFSHYHGKDISHELDKDISQSSRE